MNAARNLGMTAVITLTLGPCCLYRFDAAPAQVVLLAAGFPAALVTPTTTVSRAKLSRSWPGPTRGCASRSKPPTDSSLRWTARQVRFLALGLV